LAQSSEVVVVAFEVVEVVVGFAELEELDELDMETYRAG